MKCRRTWRVRECAGWRRSRAELGCGERDPHTDAKHSLPRALWRTHRRTPILAFLPDDSVKAEPKPSYSRSIGRSLTPFGRMHVLARALRDIATCVPHATLHARTDASCGRRRRHMDTCREHERRAVAAAVSAEQLVESGCVSSAGRSGLGRVRLVHRVDATDAPRLRRERFDRQHPELRVPLCRRRWHVDETSGTVSIRRRERRSRSHDGDEHPVLSDPGRSHHAGPLDRRRRSRERRPQKQRRPSSADRRSRQPVLYTSCTTSSTTAVNGTPGLARSSIFDRTGVGRTGGRRPTRRGLPFCRVWSGTTKRSARPKSRTRSGSRFAQPMASCIRRHTRQVRRRERCRWEPACD